jgi:dienelactone hydrolase
MVSLIAGKDTAFKLGIQTSPAMVSPEDATKVQIPMCILASKEESVDDIKKYAENLTVTKHVETFDTEVHGWMSARADLSNEKTKAEYERGYKIALQFLQDNM